MFVWAVIFSFFAFPRAYQFRVLFWGILGAIFFRGIFIFAGVALIERFDWVLYVFGAFLLWAVLLFPVSLRRDRLAGTTHPAGTLKGDLLVVLIGVAAWVAFAFWLHLWLIGVNPLA